MYIYIYKILHFTTKDYQLSVNDSCTVPTFLDMRCHASASYCLPCQGVKIKYKNVIEKHFFILQVVVFPTIHYQNVKVQKLVKAVLVARCWCLSLGLLEIIIEIKMICALFDQKRYDMYHVILVYFIYWQSATYY